MWPAARNKKLRLQSLSVEEQLTGWYTRIRRTKKSALLAQAYERLTRNVRYLAEVPTILSFTEPAILRFEQLKKLRLNVPNTDLRIAAIILEHSGILVSRNLRDFQRVPNLVVENWSI